MHTNKYTGLSLTDRLSDAGLLESFSKALRDKDEATVLLLLHKVELTEEQARDTLKSLLLDPNSHRHFS